MRGLADRAMQQMRKEKKNPLSSYYLDMLNMAEIVKIDNVVDFLYKNKLTGDHVKDFPSPVPPFHVMFMEWENTARPNEERKYPSAGVLLNCIDTQKCSKEMLERIDEKPTPSCRWMMGLCFLVEDSRRHVHSLKIAYVMWVEESGHIYTAGEKRAMLSLYRITGEGALLEEEKEEALNVAGQIIPLTALSLSFANCRNVTLQHSRPKNQEQRQARRVYGREIKPHYTLEIGPMQKILAEEGQSGQVGMAKALHICRGHFQEYGPSFQHADGKAKGLLFGKHAGRFWVPQSVRGAAEIGVISKDYAVRAPADN